jgi:hypothetical protein
MRGAMPSCPLSNFILWCLGTGTNLCLQFTLCIVHKIIEPTQKLVVLFKRNAHV